MVYNSSMPTKLTPEEKTARAAVKKQERIMAKVAARAAELEAKKKAWEEKRNADKENFLTSMSEEDRKDFEEAIQQTSSTVNPVTSREEVTNEFIHSLKSQYASRGFLSPKQVEVLLRSFRQKRDLAKKAEGWKDIKVDDEVKIMGKVQSVEQVRDAFGTSFKIKITSSYGRAFSFKTGKEDWANEAANAKATDKWVSVVGKVKWIAPHAGGVVVLTSRGMKFGRLVK